jgi:hypothetical protein
VDGSDCLLTAYKKNIKNLANQSNFLLDLKWTSRADFKNLYHWSPILVHIPQIAFTYSSIVLQPFRRNKTHATAELPVLEQKLSQKIHVQRWTSGVANLATQFKIIRFLPVQPIQVCSLPQWSAGNKAAPRRLGN